MSYCFDAIGCAVRHCLTFPKYCRTILCQVGLETRDNPRLWVRIPAPTGSPRLLPGRCTVGCPLLQVCTLGWVKCREHISLLIILCIIVYVTNKAHHQILYVAKNGPFYAGKRFISVVETVSFIPAHCLLLRGSFVSGLHR